MESQQRVLLVDDDLSIRELLSEYLAAHDFSVDLAADGQEALDKLKNTEFDLVLSDLCIPHLDGLSLLQTAREMGLEVPFVMMTGYGTVETAVNTLKSGATDFLLKPFKLRQAMQSIQAALETNRKRTASAQSALALALYEEAQSIETRQEFLAFMEHLLCYLCEAVDAPSSVAIFSRGFLQDTDDPSPPNTGWTTLLECSPPGQRRLLDTLQPDAVRSMLTEADISDLYRPERPEDLLVTDANLSTPTVLLVAGLYDVHPGESPPQGAIVLAWQDQDHAPSPERCQAFSRMGMLVSNTLYRLRCRP